MTNKNEVNSDKINVRGNVMTNLNNGYIVRLLNALKGYKHYTLDVKDGNIYLLIYDVVPNRVYNIKDDASLLYVANAINALKGGDLK